ncbi:MAG: 4-demethylwyosine synthase TYW1 [Candidatus Micrarchaeia archaeon]
MRKNARKNIDLSTFDGRITKQGYHKVGMHSAAKMCKYAKDSVLGKNWCYKNKFYGIKSNRCLQCSPTLQFCNLACKFCWRLIPETKTGWADLGADFSWDTPEFIADGLIVEQKRIMSGFLGNEKADKKLAQEAMAPKHVALSLIGEPTMYPKLSKLLEIFHKKGMTTFLVSNGTYPNVLKNLNPLPTQLYVSLVAPDEETHAQVTQASGQIAKQNWKNYLKSLDVLNSLCKKTRTVLRMTVAHGLNDGNVQGFADLIVRSQAHYVEVKSMTFVGWARNKERGLRSQDMYSMDEIRAYAKKLAELTGYIYTDEHEPSRIVLLCRDKTAKDNRLLKL